MTTGRPPRSREQAMQTSDQIEEPVVESLETTTINRIYWRIIPLFFAMMFFNYLDRINIGFAGLRMNDDLGFGPAIVDGLMWPRLERPGERKTRSRMEPVPAVADIPHRGWGQVRASMLEHCSLPWSERPTPAHEHHSRADIS